MDLPVVQTQSEFSVETAEADKVDPPTYIHTRTHTHTLYSSFLTDNIPVRVALVFSGRADLTALSMRDDSVMSLLKAALMSSFHNDHNS